VIKVVFFYILFWKNQDIYVRCLACSRFRISCSGRSSSACWREFFRLPRFRRQHLYLRSKRSTRNSLSQQENLTLLLILTHCFAKQLALDRQIWILPFALPLAHSFYGSDQCECEHAHHCWRNALVFYALHVQYLNLLLPKKGFQYVLRPFKFKCHLATFLIVLMAF